MPFLETVRVRAYRSARDVELRLGPVTALIGEAGSGKSNLLRAIRALLDPAVPPGPEDLRGRARELSVEARLSDGSRIAVTARPPGTPRATRRGAPPVLFLPATTRSGPLFALDGEPGRVEEAVRVFRGALEGSPVRPSGSSGASALVAGADACREAGVTGVVFLIEEPELFLRPQTQRYLYRRLRAVAAEGNQVIYSTHAPAFLNVARLEEIVLVRHGARRGTHIVQPEPLEADEAFRVVSEFDAERSELFLARSVILVEGRTEKLVLPRSSRRSAMTPIGRRSPSSSAAASRTSRSSHASARRADPVRRRPRPRRERGRAADSRRDRAQSPDRVDRRPCDDRARA